MELLIIQLVAVDEANFSVIAKSTLQQANSNSRLPFFVTKDRWRTTLIKVLGAKQFNCDLFRQEEQDWMEEQGWLSSNRQSFSPSMLISIGRAMYEALFPAGKVRDVLQYAIAHAQESETQLHIRLEFKAEVTKDNRLPDYPWEIAYDGQGFLAHYQVIFSRFIANGTIIPQKTRVNNLNVLLAASAASDLDIGLLPLSKKEQKAVFRGLEKSQAEGFVHLNILETVSLNQLRQYLLEHQGEQAPHIFHFDGHGVFGRRCNIDSCRTIHTDLRTETCRRCDSDLPEPQGYLLFETDDDEADYVSAIELGELLHKTSFNEASQQSGVTVAVLSACKSSMALGGESIFNGVAQRLISHRVPAVVAMQYIVRVNSTTQFAEHFYRSLGQKNSLAMAMSHGQEAMGSEGNQWYRPILYLRWRDNDGGQLFFPKGTTLQTLSKKPSTLTSEKRNKNHPKSPFSYNGPLQLDSKVYITRKCDEDLSNRLRAGRLIAIQGGFQDGKTSLLRRIEKMSFYHQNGWNLCYIDFQSMRIDNTEVFIARLFQKISRFLKDKVSDWGEICDALNSRKVIFCFDEFGKLKSDSVNRLMPGLYWLATQPNIDIRIIVCLPLKIEYFLKGKLDDPKYYSNWKTIFVPPFSTEEVGKLLNFLPVEMSKFTYELREKIHLNSSGKPGKIQYLCACLFEANRQAQLREKDIIEIINSPKNYDPNCIS